jgi:hypothetical protein
MTIMKQFIKQKWEERKDDGIEDSIKIRSIKFLKRKYIPRSRKNFRANLS